MKIVVDLIPETSFGHNIRSEFPKQWDSIRTICYDRAGYRCEICHETGKKQGFKHDVECHEFWEYLPQKEMRGIQKLVRFAALCPKCHQCHHLGMAEINGTLTECLNRIRRINKLDAYQTSMLYVKAMQVWNERSEFQWTLDTSYINDFLIKYKKHKAAWALN